MWRIIEGDCRTVLRSLDAGSVHTCVTSPPYFGLRDYGHDEQIGLEPTPDAFVAALVGVFRAVRRVLRDDGTVWLNLGDSYAGSWGAQGRDTPRIEAHDLECDMGADCTCSQAGDPGEDIFDGRATGYGLSATQIHAHPRKQTRTGSIPAGAPYKPKDLLGIPWLVAFALRADGWYLRSEIIWHKPNPMPESVTDRPTKAHEQVFLLSKNPRYYYDADGIREDWVSQGSGVMGVGPRALDRDWQGQSGASTLKERDASTGRNRRSVWTVATQPYAGAHFATFPPKLIEPCILAGCPERCCSECGAPWERVVEIESRPNWAPEVNTQKHDGTHYRPNIGGGVGNDSRARHDRGFEPSCTHNADPTPGTVLDPFAGAGTTGMVALRHGRSFVGIELSPEYAALARRRVCDDAPLFNTVSELVA